MFRRYEAALPVTTGIFLTRPLVRLTTHFEAISDIPALALASESRAANLVSLLPKRAQLRVSKSLETGTNNFPNLSISWTTVALVGAVVLALVLKLFQTG